MYLLATAVLLLLVGPPVLLGLYLRRISTSLFDLVRAESSLLEHHIVEWMIANARSQGYKSSQEWLLGELGIDDSTEDYQLEVARRNELIRREAMLPLAQESSEAPASPTDQSSHSQSSTPLPDQGMPPTLVIHDFGRLRQLMEQHPEWMHSFQGFVKDSSQEPEISHGGE